MTTKVQRWGNSLALRIPKSFAEDVHLSQGMDVDLSVIQGKLIINPVTRPKYSLAKLLKGITKKNMPSWEDVDTGRPVGKEIW